MYCFVFLPLGSCTGLGPVRAWAPVSSCVKSALAQTAVKQTRAHAQILYDCILLILISAAHGKIISLILPFNLPNHKVNVEENPIVLIVVR